MSSTSRAIAANSVGITHALGNVSGPTRTEVAGRRARRRTRCAVGAHRGDRIALLARHEIRERRFLPPERNLIASGLIEDRTTATLLRRVIDDRQRRGSGSLIRVAVATSRAATGSRVELAPEVAAFCGNRHVYSCGGTGTAPIRSSAAIF
jgi:hypothetical protein